MICIDRWLNQIIEGDCLEVMQEMPDDCIDSIVTDPPYELGFMGKKWDSTGIAYNVDMWRECLRVLKPGGHLLSFGGTRTYHRMVCAIEDAGFEIRDCIQWIYGSGFPKSHNISKALDGVLGKQGKGFKTAGDDGRKAEFEQNLSMRSDYGYVYNPTTPEAQQWFGFGTALKPANEPIVLARKPISEKTVADNVLKWGTGGLNIDGCRVGTEVRNNPQAGFIRRGRTDEEVFLGTDKNRPEGTVEVTGRFPANVILDEEAGRLLDEQSGISKSTGGTGESSRGALGNRVYGKYENVNPTSNMGGLGDVGGASRFFYCAKASKKERGEGNNHPTVKPISLMRYLVRLVTPPGGIVLDPFTGSGTTLIASKLEGFSYLGIEREQQYIEIAKARLEHWLPEEDKNDELQEALF